MYHTKMERKIEETRTKMIHAFEDCNSLTNSTVIKLSQELDSLLNNFAFHREKNKTDSFQFTDGWTKEYTL